MSEEKTTSSKKKAKTLPILVAAAVIAVAIFVAWSIMPKTVGKPNQEPEVVTDSTLKKIINVSELSTFTAVYNGIAQVNNNEKPEQIDYYVSYEATVKAGINLDQLNINIVDSEDEAGKKTIHVTIPDVYITEANVDISSLDYIFMNDKANTSTVTETAFKACEADVKAESKIEDAIFELADQNAKNTVKALVEPFIEQWGDAYALVIE